MPVDVLQTLDIIEALENFLERNRPPENIRQEVDLAYRIEDQSVIIFEIRPAWDKPGEIYESNIARSTITKNKNTWKVFWMRADSKWHSYTPAPTVKHIKDFIKLVEEDKHGCFWG